MKLDSVGEMLEEVEKASHGIYECMDTYPHVFRDSIVVHMLIGLAEGGARRQRMSRSGK